MSLKIAFAILAIILSISSIIALKAIRQPTIVEKDIKVGATLNPNSDSLLNGLEVYYNLDEQDTTGNGTIYDSLGSYNGINAGGQASVGKIGNAYNFFGSQYIDTNYGAGKDFLEYSISAWVRTTDDNGGGIVQSRQGEGNVDGLNFGGNLKAGFDAGDLTNKGVSGMTNINDDSWRHLVGVFNGAKLLIYVDGVLENSVNTSGFVHINNSFNIARDAYPFYLIGTVDEVGIWNRALTPGEITRLYHNGDGITYPFSLDLSSPDISNTFIEPSSIVAGKSFHICADITDSESGIKQAGINVYRNYANVNYSLSHMTGDIYCAVIKTSSGDSNYQISIMWAEDNSDNYVDVPINFTLEVEPVAYACTDINRDHVDDIFDVVTLINYVFRNSPSPCTDPLLASQFQSEASLQVPNTLEGALNYMQEGNDVPQTGELV